MKLSEITKRLDNAEWIPILLARLAVGALFFESGRGKLFYKLEELGEYFAQLGIPFPQLNAVTVASIEFVGGICLLLGLATRLVSAPLAVIMPAPESSRSTDISPGGWVEFSDGGAPCQPVGQVFWEPPWW
ncbi:MAG: DoxX family protein [Deltaproteobacteria bacterium]|nr:DoxX family protein [Deltaproteobacteria bacterium]